MKQLKRATKAMNRACNNQRSIWSNWDNFHVEYYQYSSTTGIVYGVELSTCHENEVGTMSAYCSKWGKHIHFSDKQDYMCIICPLSEWSSEKDKKGFLKGLGKALDNQEYIVTGTDRND